MKENTNEMRGLVKINSITKYNQMQHKIQTAHLRNQSAEQRARKVLPRRAKITKTQYELFVKSEQQKKEERRVKKR